jgi:4-hydroxybenzoate polyprenyltransferase
MTAVLAAEAAPTWVVPALVTPAMLFSQFSVGCSKDARYGARDAAAGRTDKPAARGEIGVRALWTAAFVSVAAALALSAAASPLTLAIDTALIAMAWAYNLGLKSTVWSGAAYLLAFGGLPAFIASALPGNPAPRAVVSVAAALLGLGAHFANVLPDLEADLRAGIRGLPQQVAQRWGPRATRAVALALLLSVSVLLLVAASPGRRWVAAVGLGCAGVLALAGMLSGGRVPFRAALAIAGLDVAVFVLAGEALASAHR